jgi:hypothetical protein
MSQIILVSLAGLFLLWFVDYGLKKRKKAEKQSWLKASLPNCYVDGCLFSVFEIAMFAAGIGSLYLMMWATHDFVREYQTLQLLQRHGVQVNVPLIDVSMDDRGKRTYYEAVYEYDGAKHEQRITENQYNALKNRSTVNLLVYEDISRIDDTPLNYRRVIQVIATGTMGLIMLRTSLKDSYRFVRYILQVMNKKGAQKEV